MISAIGGTMGLCIGISFYNIIGTGLDWLPFGIDWQRSQDTKSQTIFTKTNSIAQANISSLADMKKELIQELSKEILEKSRRDLSNFKAEVGLDIEEKLVQELSTKIFKETKREFAGLKGEVDDLKKRFEQKRQ